MTTPPVSLAEVRAQLNLKSDQIADDEELWRKLLAATSRVEAEVGPMMPRAVVGSIRSTSRGNLILPVWPVLSVEEVRDPADTVVGSGTYEVDLAAGHIRLCTYFRQWWTVYYTVGQDPVPEDLMEATLVVAAHLWETQRGPILSAASFRGAGQPAMIPARGFGLPNRARELMAPYLVPVL
jgi:hypothetical protein